MFRYAERYLLEWIQKKEKSPLLIRGARQVGKTYLVETLGRQHFNQMHVINFELMPECTACFSTLDPEEILRRLNLLKGFEIRTEDTLLFLDEVQQCPEAILALRYFKEKMPGLAVIAAGSLLEFTLNDVNFRMPVGRVEFMHMHPLSFKEFLLALGEKSLVSWIESIHIKDTQDPIYPALHEKCLGLLREYCIVGGMPEALRHYVKNRSHIQELQNQQGKLLQGYVLDFGKYAKTNIQHKNLQNIFAKLPQCVGHQVRYHRIDPNLASREIRTSLEMLKLAGLCHFVWGASGAGLPLGATINEKKLKLTYVDVGLYLRALYLDPKTILWEELDLVNEGALCEQFVAQELLVSKPCFEKAQLYFWAREAAGSQAEVDYLWQIHDKIIPIEVKSGASAWLKSLNLFKQIYASPFGVRFSSRHLAWDEAAGLFSIPLYLVSEMDRLLGQ